MNRSLESTDVILDRQRHGWLRGDRPDISSLAKSVNGDRKSDLLLDLIYQEIVIREEIGEVPSVDEYVRRFPQLSDEISMHFEVHQAVADEFLEIANEQLSEAKDDAKVADVGGSGVRDASLSNYVIKGEIGRGAMGVVYRAEHRSLKRHVAIKMFQPGRKPTARDLARFRAEAEAVARLQDPNIVQIFEVGENDGLPFLVLELADKGTLQGRLQGRPLEAAEAAHLIETLSRAMHHCHQRNIIHRDLKPANVLFAQDGTPKIADFGLAKLRETTGDPSDATKTGEPIGTPRYMSPEQAEGRGADVTPAADVYALGSLLYECLTGQAPFVSASFLETVQRIRTEEPVAPRRRQPSTPKDLETICLNCLKKDPRRRYATALDLADDLRRFRQSEPIRARPTALWERAWLWSKRRPAAATLVGMITALILAVPLGWALNEQHNYRRIAELRSEVNGIIQEAHHAQMSGDAGRAVDRFQLALSKIQSEPALRTYELGIRGWLDQSIRDGEQQRWRSRRQPPLFIDRRDDALLLAADVSPDCPESLRVARQAISDALEFTSSSDAATWADRETLLLLESILLQKKGGEAAAKPLHDRVSAGQCRRPGGTPEAGNGKTGSLNSPRHEAMEGVLFAVELLLQDECVEAVAVLDGSLALEPHLFVARLLQARCFLRLERPAEAKVALTACMGQRPFFARSHIMRSDAYRMLGDYRAAAQDLQTASELIEPTSERDRIAAALKQWHDAVAALPRVRQELLWGEELLTSSGRSAIRQIEMFANSKPVRIRGSHP